MDEFDKNNKLEKKNTKKYVERKEEVDTKLSVNDFEQIILEVDSITNKMVVKVKVDDGLKEYKNFVVSTEYKEQLG